MNLGPLGLVADTVWAWDYSTYRVTFYDLEGELLGSRQAPVSFGDRPGDNPPRALTILADGTLIGGPAPFTPLIASGQMTRQLVFEMDWEGKVGDSLYAADLQNSWLSVTLPRGGRRTVSTIRQPFSDTELTSTSSGFPRVAFLKRLVFADGMGEARLRMVDVVADSLLWEVALPAPVEPIRSEEVDEFIVETSRDWAEGALRDYTPARIAEELEAEMYNPGYHAPYDLLKAGKDGSVWVGRRERIRAGRDVDEVEDETTWVVVDATGEIRGRVSLPATLHLREVTEDRAWGLHLDDLGIPYIVRTELR